MYKVTSGPASEPLTTSTVKDYLKIDTSEDDTIIGDMITAAREWVEKFTSMSMIQKTIEEVWDSFPVISRENPTGALRPTFGPFVSLTSVSYVDSNGDTQTFTDTRVDEFSYPPRIVPIYGSSWPEAQKTVNAVKVTYIAGHTASSDIPTAIKQAMLLMIADLYENRVDEPISRTTAIRPPTASINLLRMFRKNRF